MRKCEFILRKSRFFKNNGIEIWKILTIIQIQGL